MTPLATHCEVMTLSLPLLIYYSLQQVAALDFWLRDVKV